MLLILGLAFIALGLWEELIAYLNALQEDEDVMYYAALTFIKIMGVFMVIIYAVAHVYGQ